MNHNQDPSAKKGSTIRQALGVATAGAFVVWAVLHSADKGGRQRDPGQPEQRDPRPPAARVSEAHEVGKEHHPLTSYMSGTGPDGERDYYMYRSTENGGYELNANRIDGGTPAPASAGPRHERHEHPQEHPEK